MKRGSLVLMKLIHPQQLSRRGGMLQPSPLSAEDSDCLRSSKITGRTVFRRAYILHKTNQLLSFRTWAKMIFLFHRDKIWSKNVSLLFNYWHSCWWHIKFRQFLLSICCSFRQNITSRFYNCTFQFPCLRFLLFFLKYLLLLPFWNCSFFFLTRYHFSHLT